MHVQLHMRHNQSLLPASKGKVIDVRPLSGFSRVQPVASEIAIAGSRVRVVVLLLSFSDNGCMAPVHVTGPGQRDRQLLPKLVYDQIITIQKDADTDTSRLFVVLMQSEHPTCFTYM